ncbi:hypothetical protein A33M_1583 [Rhodovulum sp. PH10]|nr:hypothetical protein A33M_1583 [Rhodovulum sp. PH10]
MGEHQARENLHLDRAIQRRGVSADIPARSVAEASARPAPPFPCRYSGSRFGHGYALSTS